MSNADFLFFFGLALFTEFLLITVICARKFATSKYLILIFVLAYFLVEAYFQFGVLRTGHLRSSLGIEAPLSIEIYISYPIKMLVILAGLLYFSFNPIEKEIGKQDSLPPKTE